jgi:hypothetical protein
MELFQNKVLIPFHLTEKKPVCKDYNNLDQTPTTFKVDDYNWGLQLGSRNNFTVIDIDIPKLKHFGKFENGIAEIINLQEKNGYFDTLTQITTNGGRHFVFNHCPQLTHEIHVHGFTIDILQRNCILIEPSSYNGNTYKFIDKSKPITDVPKWFIEWAQTSPIQKETIAEKVEQKKLVKVTKDIVAKTHDIFYITDEYCWNLLNSLDAEYCDKTFKWLQITSVLKSIDKKQIWDEWSKQSQFYNKVVNQEKWDSIVNCKYDLTFLLKLYNNKQTEKNKLFVFPTRDYIPISKVKCNTIDLKVEQLAKDRNGVSRCISLDNVHDNIKKFKYIIMKADTGTGKTTTTSRYYKRFTSNGYKVLSIISRRSLSNTHIEKFQENGIKLVSDQDKDWDKYNDHTVIQIDSIRKMKSINDFSKYVVFVDEINSFIKYVISSSTMMGKQLEILNLFRTIVKKCKKLICCDADVSDSVLEFFDLHVPAEQTVLVTNPFKNYQNINAFHYHDKQRFINKIKSCITKDEGFICCFQERGVMNDIFNLVYDDSKKDRFLKYSSQEGGEIKNPTLEWAGGKFVFISPRVVYGVDFDIPDIASDVFIYMTTKTLGPLEIVQQMTRCRNIKNIHFTLSKFQTEPILYDSVADVKQHYESSFENYIEIFNRFGAVINDPVNDDIRRINSKFMELVYIDIYNDGLFHSNFLYHFRRILQKKGIVISELGIEMKIKVEDMKEAKAMTKTQYEEALDSFMKGTCNNEQFVKSMNAKLDKLHITKEDLDNNPSFVELLSDSEFRNHLNRVNLLRKHKTTVDAQTNSLNSNLKNKALQSISSKILMCKKVEKILGIERLDIDHDDVEHNFDNEIEISDAEYKTLLGIFRDRSQAKVKPTTWKGLYHLLIDCYRKIGGNGFIKSEKVDCIVKKVKTTQRHYSLDDATIQIDLNLLKFRELKLKSISGSMCERFDIDPNEDAFEYVLAE